MEILYSRKKRHSDRTVRCYLTLDCNGGCEYCSAGVPDITQEIKELYQPPEIWAEGINRRARECILAGGEPFLYPRLAELVNMLNVRIQIYTNLKCDVKDFLNAVKRPVAILASCHPMSAYERQIWLENVMSVIRAGHHVRFHIVKYGNWVERLDFIRGNRIVNQVTCCDDQRSGVKSSGEEVNEMMLSVSCSNTFYAYGPDGYRYPCITLMGRGECKQEHISEPDDDDTIIVPDCNLFGLCVGCDNNIEGEVISRGNGQCWK